MNKRSEALLKNNIKLYKEYVEGWDLFQLQLFVEHEWHMPASLSMILYLDEDAYQYYLKHGLPEDYIDELECLKNLNSKIVRYLNGDEVTFNENEQIKLSFDITVTGGVYGCRIANSKNTQRYARAIWKLIGKWDGFVDRKTYFYIHRQLNAAIKDEEYRRRILNEKLPNNLQMPI